MIFRQRIVRGWKGMVAQLRAKPTAQCGHLPQEERPDIVNALLNDCLDVRKPSFEDARNLG
jgi:pimeloyl-ACP methyl ester carboxylesterase